MKRIALLLAFVTLSGSAFSDDDYYDKFAKLYPPCGVKDPQVDNYPAPPFYFDPARKVGCWTTAGWWRYEGEPCNATCSWRFKYTYFRSYAWLRGDWGDVNTQKAIAVEVHLTESGLERTR